MSDFSDLIARVEAASGPDREIDGAICLALGWTFQKMKGDSKPYYRRPGETAYYLRSTPPEYTASIDAALKLLPDGVTLDLKLFANRTGYACSWARHGNRSSSCATFELAALSAILKARQASTEGARK